METENANTPIAIACRHLAFALRDSPRDERFESIDNIQKGLNDLAFAIVDELEARLG